MADPDTDSAALPELPATLEASLEYIDGVSQPPPLPLETPARPTSWESISEEQDFYDEQGYLRLRQTLSIEKLKDRKEDEVVIFGYSLTQADTVAGPTVEYHGFFFTLCFSSEFPQCYDTSDDNLLNSMAKELQLQNANTFGDSHSKRVLALPGRGKFRTGISLRVPSKRPSELARPVSSEDRITLFVSFPYFGQFSGSSPLGPESESVELLDFKHLGVDAPDRSAVISREEKDDIGEILVHQARYMIFDNYTVAIFRSKEDNSRDQVPLHHFQERIGAFYATVHMIANRMDSEALIVEYGKEEDIDRVILDEKTSEDNKVMKGTPASELHQLELPLGVALTEKQEPKGDEDCKRAQQDKVQKRKQRRVRDLLISLNRLSASLFAAISVAERQVAVLQDLHSVLLTGYLPIHKSPEKRYPLRRNRLYKNTSIDLTPVLPEHNDQARVNILDAIDGVAQERECFIKKIKDLVENMGVRRKILFGFLKFDYVKEAPSEKTAQEATCALKRIERAIRESQVTLIEQDKALFGFAVIATAFLPLNFCTSYYGMDVIGDQEGPISITDFWLTAGPLTISLLIPIIMLTTWKRPVTVKFGGYIGKKFSRSPKEKTDDIENQSSGAPKSQEQAVESEKTKIGSPSTSGSLYTGAPGGVSTTLLETSTGPNPPSESVAKHLSPREIQSPRSP
ncbi:hypothetical protein B9Z19DRAFT_1063916 [Tuber borchii]|uniref:Uncharacterized protein n=1 Tax=Tuber borchii TaxID=42251 RepID=A0A2T6ZWF8_TUBBO|nr:hypothetical protein B9Z19DRAFT_1063916 [Tuber borchii]